MGPFSRKAVGAFAAASLAGCQQAPPPPKPVPATYALNRCGGLPANWQAQGDEYGEMVNRNLLEVGHAGLLWNRAKISEPTLRQYLAVVQTMPAAALVAVFEPDAKCDTVVAIRKAFDDLAHCGKDTNCIEYSVAEHAKMVAKMTPPPCDAKCEEYRVKAMNPPWDKKNTKQSQVISRPF